MDGNRRWAKNQGLPVTAGHWRGAERLIAIVRAAKDLGIKVLTVYAFSTENWVRPPVEVRALMGVFKTYLKRQRNLMINEGVRLNTIGDISRLPKDVLKVLEETVEATKQGTKLDLVIALNYGGRDELKRAFKTIIDDCLAKKISHEALSEELISSYLDTARWKDPDLLIRTSGESRLSNFLLWQISYAEVVVTDVLWPDFSEKDLTEAIREYQKREQRLGK
ncbi:MAG: di-trans,poly-cis-decaprenylcistransferase [Verrucomicrobia bacterium]|nr:di-trans,poly-cis-decaprenylcistransferase [Verrucomicrobiota bacterium]